MLQRGEYVEFKGAYIENLNPKGLPYFEKIVREGLTQSQKDLHLRPEEETENEPVHGEGQRPDRAKTGMDLEDVQPEPAEAVSGDQRRGGSRPGVQGEAGEDRLTSRGPGRTGVQQRGPGGRGAGISTDERGEGAGNIGVGERPARSEDRNHLIAPDDEIVPKGTEGKIQANISAIQLLKLLKSENRNPTPDEKKTLGIFLWQPSVMYSEI